MARIIRYGAGLDIGSEKFRSSISYQTEDGHIQEVSNREFSNSLSGFKALVLQIKKYCTEEGIPLRITMEVTGVYHEEVLFYLYEKGYKASLILSKRVKKYFEFLGHISKTDEGDARGLSILACKEQFPLWKPLNAHILEIRGLMRHRKTCVDGKTAQTNRLHAATRSHGESKIVESSLKRMLKMYEKEIAGIEKKVLILVKKDIGFYNRVKQITESMPGHSLISILTIISETNGFEEFKSIKQLESYAGYDVVENSSGKYEGKTKISKKGNVHLRTALYMPSLTIVRLKSEPFYNLYSRVNERHGWKIKSKGLVAIQRKALGIIYTIWKKQEPFIKDYQNKGQKNMPVSQPA